MSTIKFSVDLEELKKKIGFIKHGLGASSSSDMQIKLIKFDIQGKKAILFAANKEVFTRAEMKIYRPDDDDANGSFAVLGQKMEQLCGHAQSEQIHFEAEEEELRIKTGFLNLNFQTFGADLLRQIEHGVSEHTAKEGLVADRTGLEEGLIYAKTCTSTTTLKPENGHVEVRGGRMMASDDRKIMVYTHAGFPEEMLLKVPTSALDRFAGAVRAIDADQVQIIEGSSYFFVKANRAEYALGVRKVERAFSDIEALLSVCNAPVDRFSLDSKALAKVVNGVALALEREDVQVIMEVAGETPEAYMEISGYNKIGKRSYERTVLGARVTTESLSFPVSFKHLLETAAGFKGDSVIDMEAVRPGGYDMILVRDSTAAREVVTLIPVRTKKFLEQEQKEAEQRAAAKKAETEASIQEAAEAADLTEGAVEQKDLDLD